MMDVAGIDESDSNTIAKADILKDFILGMLALIDQPIKQE